MYSTCTFYTPVEPYTMEDLVIHLFLHSPREAGRYNCISLAPGYRKNNGKLEGKLGGKEWIKVAKKKGRNGENLRNTQLPHGQESIKGEEEISNCDLGNRYLLTDTRSVTQFVH